MDSTHEVQEEIEMNEKVKTERHLVTDVSFTERSPQLRLVLEKFSSIIQ